MPIESPIKHGAVRTRILNRLEEELVKDKPRPSRIEELRKEMGTDASLWALLFGLDLPGYRKATWKVFGSKRVFDTFYTRRQVLGDGSIFYGYSAGDVERLRPAQPSLNSAYNPQTRGSGEGKVKNPTNPPACPKKHDFSASLAYAEGRSCPLCFPTETLQGDASRAFPPISKENNTCQ